MDVLLQIFRFILIFNAALVLIGIPWYIFVGRHRPVPMSIEELSVLRPADTPHSSRNVEPAETASRT